MSAIPLLLAAEQAPPEVPAILIPIIVLGILFGLLAVTLFLGGGRPHD